MPRRDAVPRRPEISKEPEIRASEIGDQQKTEPQSYRDQNHSKGQSPPEAGKPQQEG